MEGSCDFFSLFQVPDVVILLLTRYLDGPSACALTQTCLRFHLFVKSRYQLHISLRTAPKDYGWYIRRRLESARVCKYCLRIDKCHGTCHASPRKTYCDSCGTRGTRLELQPWKIHAFPPNTTCSKCQKPLETFKDYFMAKGCLKCRVTCCYCLGRPVKCKNGIMYLGREQETTTTTPVTFWQSLCMSFSCSRNDDDDEYETTIIYDNKYIIRGPFSWTRIRPSNKKR